MGGPNDGTAHKKRKFTTSHAAVSKGEVITHGDGDPQTKKARAKAPKKAEEQKALWKDSVSRDEERRSGKHFYLDALETEKEVENDVKRFLNSRMQPK